MQYVYVGKTELVALLVGLTTGFIYSWLRLPIPAPGVLGGIFAIIFTYIGYLIVQKFRGEITFGRPAVIDAETAATDTAGDQP